MGENISKSHFNKELNPKYIRSSNNEINCPQNSIFNSYKGNIKQLGVNLIRKVKIYTLTKNKDAYRCVLIKDVQMVKSA